MSDHVNERDEFLLSQLLDGQLAEAEAVALRIRIQNEPQLARAFDEMGRLDALLHARGGDRPAVDYQAFHQNLMTHVDALSRGVSDEDEYLLSRMLDGDLAGEEESTVLRRLAAEPALRACHESLSQVNEALVARRADAPSVDYEAFHEELMEKVEAESGRAAPRIVRFPTWARFAAPLAVAAAIAFAVLLRPGSTPSPIPSHETDQVARNIPEPVAPAVDQAVREPVQIAQADDKPLATVRTTLAAYHADVIVVDMKGERPERATSSELIEVKFARSTDLAQATQKGDDERARQPSRKIFFVAAKPSKPAAAGVGGELF